MDQYDYETSLVHQDIIEYPKTEADETLHQNSEIEINMNRKFHM